MLPTDVAVYLVAWLSKKQPSADELLLPMSVRSGGTDRCTAKMMRHDLLVARARWLPESGATMEPTIREASYVLVYQDSQGRFANFHATRHAFITNLHRGGISPKTAQQLARHSDIRLTMNVYSHADLSQKREAVQTLPNILGQRGSADGTLNAAEGLF